MERRNFFKIAPFGLAGIAALVTNPLTEESPIPSERFRIDSSGNLVHSTTLTPAKIAFFSNGTETFSL